MSKNRVIVLSITNQNLTISEAAKKYKVSERWIYKLLAKEKAGGIEAVEKTSTRPKFRPKQAPEATKNAIIDLRTSLAKQGIDNGEQTISWYLLQQGITAHF